MMQCTGGWKYELTSWGARVGKLLVFQMFGGWAAIPPPTRYEEHVLQELFQNKL